jgi:hypothetical protein
LPDIIHGLQRLGPHVAFTNDAPGADLTIREEVLGPEHPATARSLNNLAVLIENLVGALV